MDPHAAVMLPIIAEVSVGLAASTGIILALTRDPEHWRPFDAIRVLMLLTTTLSTAVIALLPFALLAAGLSEPVVWRSCSGGITVETVGVLVLLLGRIRAMERHDRAGFTPWVFVPLNTIGTLNIVAQSLNAAGVVFAGEPAVVLAGLLWGVASSAIIFILLVFRRPPTRQTT